MNYYNEFDPKAAAWLRELINAGHIPQGEVDTRSITEVSPNDLKGFIQCHFFAGIAGWPFALHLAGVDSAKPLWTGSCPCQPFSVAGKGLGTADERHLWPVFADLIRECRPPAVLGEQVASRAGREWLTGVFADLEGLGYAVAGADLCAAGVGAPHIRQRLYWVADADSWQCRRIAASEGCESNREATRWQQSDGEPERGGPTCGVGDADSAAKERLRFFGVPMEPEQKTGRPGYADAWKGATPLRCSDGKERRIKPEFFPLAHGIPGRVGLLRGYGNAIVPQVAAAFIKAALI